jgi:SAM-dependent methyltransferase
MLYFDQLGIWGKLAGASILHLAPEKHLAARIETCQPERYVKGDLVPSREGVERIDVTQIPHADASFDWVICNHVLEHVPDDARALNEIWRVLRPGGSAILQTPFASGLETSLEDPEIATDAKRIEFYGQEDHVRLYGCDLFDRIRAPGFQLTLVKHAECLPAIDARRYGVNPDEPLFLCVKVVPDV